MPVPVDEVCTITAKGQTTVPKSVRQALGVGYGGRIAFRVERDQVTVRALAAGDPEYDPALAAFLALLEADLAGRPASSVRPLDQALAKRLESAVDGVGVFDPDESIEGDSSL